MTKQEEIREGIAKKLAFYACEDEWDNLVAFKQQVYLDQALAIMEYEISQGVVIKVDREAGFDNFPMPIRGDMLSKKAWAGWKKMILFFFHKAGYVAVEPLVEE